jgi:hypothetical protein
MRAPAGSGFPAGPAAGAVKPGAGAWAVAIGNSANNPSTLANTSHPVKLGKMDFILGFCRICQRNEM